MTGNDIQPVESGFVSIRSTADFDDMARVVHRYQKEHNSFFKAYNAGLFVPIDVFKRIPVTCFPPVEAEAVFISSGTGTTIRSHHHVKRTAIYEASILSGFRRVFGTQKVILVAHVPSYGPDSSLIWMMHCLMEHVALPGSGFSTEDPDLLDKGARLSFRNQELLVLFGAAFGLLDLLETHPVKLPETAVVVETGGMKTHRRHVPRRELHERFSKGFGVPLDRIRSEYGMCELLSQCYTQADGLFRSPPWMRWDVRNPSNPERSCHLDEEGVLVVTDLANMYSLSFIITEDRAVRRTGADGSEGFEILGRMSQAELRGCNFLFEG